MHKEGAYCLLRFIIHSQSIERYHTYRETMVRKIFWRRVSMKNGVTSEALDHTYDLFGLVWLFKIFLLFLV